MPVSVYETDVLPRPYLPEHTVASAALCQPAASPFGPISGRCEFSSQPGEQEEVQPILTEEETRGTTTRRKTTERHHIMALIDGDNTSLFKRSQNNWKLETDMEVNILGLMATALFIIIPTAFLLILYVKTASQEA